jgi:hypothetical protein
MSPKRSNIGMDVLAGNLSEVEWAHRFEKRQEGVRAVKRSTAYEKVGDMIRDGDISQRMLPLTPRPDDRRLSKRRWEAGMMAWREALRDLSGDRRARTAARREGLLGIKQSLEYESVELLIQSGLVPASEKPTTPRASEECHAIAWSMIVARWRSRLHSLGETHFAGAAKRDAAGGGSF